MDLLIYVAELRIYLYPGELQRLSFANQMPPAYSPRSLERDAETQASTFFPAYETHLL